MKRYLTAIFILGSSSAQAFTLVAPSSNLEGWNTDVLKFHLNPENCPLGVENLLDDAIELWNSVPTSRLRIERGDDTNETLAAHASGGGSATPAIFCVTDMAAIGGDPHAIPGQATGYRFSGTHISAALLVLNADPSGRANVAVLDENKVKVVIAHEIGHVLGLGHSEDKAALMYYDATAKKELALAADDADGLTYLYPRNELGQDGFMGCASLPIKSKSFQLAILTLFLAPLSLLALKGAMSQPK